MRVLGKAVAVLFAAVLFGGTASAATFYVATTGSDANPGTIDRPFATISHAAGLVAPGDEVDVRGGVYYGQVSIPSHGTSSARIVFRSYPGETAIIDGTGMAAGSVLVILYNAAYVDFSNFEVRNSQQIGVCAWETGQGLRITGNNIHHSVRNGIWVGSDTNVNAYSDITVTGNDVHDNVLENAASQMTSGGWASGIVIGEANGVVISNNRVHNNHGEGMGTGLSNNSRIENNVVYDNFSANMYFDNARYVLVNRNLVYNTPNPSFYRAGYPAVGIGTANETWSLGSNTTGNITVTNNIVVNARWGFYYGNYDTGGGLHNCVIANNTFYHAFDSVIRIEADNHTNNIVENNVFVQTGGLSMSSVVTTGFTYSHNLWYGGVAGLATGVGDVNANPSLTNAGGLTAADYKLLSGSPAVSAGVSATAVTTDYFGAARGATFDIGAHQLGTSSGATPTPTLDTTAPSAPAGLAAVALNDKSISLTWAAATDNVGVTGYSIYRNGALVTTTTGTSFTDSNLTSSTSYTYTIKAYDAAGNVSAASNSVTTSTLPSGVLPGGSVDTIAPAVPANLVAVTGGTSAITLTWNASTDNVKVTGYRITRNGVDVVTVTGTSYTDSGLAASTTYTYSVRALDAAGNVSGASNSSSATTLANAPAPDTTAPTAPTSLSAVASNSSSIALTWSASTDNVKVTGYRIARNGVDFVTITGTSYTDSGLAASTTYTYSVRALDAAGNASAASKTASATTAEAKRRSSKH